MKNSLILVAIAFVLGIVISLTISNCLIRSDYPLDTVKTTPVAKVQMQVEKQDQKFNAEVDSLKKKNEVLQIEVSSSKNLLEKAKKKNTVLQTQIYDLIDRNTVDTSQRLASCDSLAAKADDLIQLNDYKDSINTSITQNYEEQLKNKDSTIDVAMKQTVSLKSVLDQSLKDQQNIESQNKQLVKSVKRKQAGNKILKGFLLIVSGLALHSLIHK